MNHYAVFFRKELLENIRTHKFLIMFTVFLIFGIMNPLTAKLTPELLAKFMPEGMSITVFEPSSLDSWAQFFKNSQQMGYMITILVFSGILGNELSRGTLINLLTKGLARQAVIIAKYASMLLIWTMSILTSFLVTWAYTVYLFPDGKTVNLLFSVLCIWLFGAFLLALLLAAATLVKSNYGSLLITGAVIIVLTLGNIIPAAGKYNPLSLATKNMDLITNTIDPSSLYVPMGITVGLSICLISLAIFVFRKKQL